MTTARAIRMGFRHGERVRPGTTFTLGDGEKLPKWCVEVSAAAKAAAPAPPPKKSPRTLSEMGKATEAERVHKADPQPPRLQ